ncbi:ATP-binding protein [Limibacillus halophilus]
MAAEESGPITASVRDDQPVHKTGRGAFVAGLLIAVLMQLSIVGLGLAGWEGTKIARSFIKAFHHYSVGQKETVARLGDYIDSGEGSDYDLFLSRLAVPLGYKNARDSLVAEQPSIIQAWTGLTLGQLSSGEANRIAYTVVYFGDSRTVRPVMESWRQLDQVLDETFELGRTARAAHEEGTMTPDLRRRLQTELRLLDDEASELEMLLTFQVSQFEERVHTTSLSAFVAASLLLLLLGVLAARFLYNRQAQMTERLVRSEERARDGLRITRAIVDAVPAYITIKDRDGAVRLVNETLARYCGMSVEEAEECINSWDDYVSISRLSHEDMEAAKQREERVWETGESLPLEEHVMHGESGEITVLETKHPLFGERGEVRYVVTVTLDVTARKEAEAMARHATKMEAIGKLTGGIAHDFNNLMMVIIGNLDFLNDSLKDNEEGLEIAQEATLAAEHAASLTQQLLAFARKQPLTPRELQLQERFGPLKSMLQRTLGEAVEVEISTPEDLCPIVADPTQLETALLNLAVNARDAMQGRGRLKIAASNHGAEESGGGRINRALPAGRYIEIAVTDDGCGMTPEVLAHAIEPFFTSKGVGEGSGLGLSMVEGFVKQSGGGMTIESEPGEGTTVRLYLPAAEVVEQAEAPPRFRAVNA